ncbi:MAG TPA: TonB-dependent receptor [Vicinamibacterales bacterium]|nr:TonB-dependent receptor [Vicinamibacterales bacterium]
MRLSPIASISLLAFLPLAAAAQTSPPSPPRIALPTVTVTAQKEPADRQAVPASVTAVSADTLWNAKISFVSDAGVYAPNTFFNEFSARKLSNVFMRGVGASPGNPGVTTYIDGVPQLNANSSNIEFTGIGQVEFVRGPQSTLFGRNTLGGVINIASERPSMTDFVSTIVVPVGNFDSREFHLSGSGPIGRHFALGLSAGHSSRDGFTVNDVTGNDLDSRQATFGKLQALWAPSPSWETRFIVSAERARDGDYALNDLGSLRRNPFHAARDFEGYTERDIFNTTVTSHNEGRRFSFSSTTGFVKWNTADETDLDYTPLPAATRSNIEDDFQFTQEFRLASAAAAPVALGTNAALRWQTGVLFFSQDYEQEAVNRLAPFVLSQFIGFPVNQTSPRAALDEIGIGLYGQATLTLRSVFDITLGARFDRENKHAILETFFSPAIAPSSFLDTTADFSNVSPQASLAYRFLPTHMLYVSGARGFKAGGFNPASPPGSEAYGEEHTWNVEGGLKTAWAGGRVTANASVFWIDWSDLQLNVPNPFVPAQFFIGNVGGATSRGAELEFNARPVSGVEIFGAAGYTRARFANGTRSSGIDVSDNQLPFTPEYTATVGAQLSRNVRNVTLYGRGELSALGAFHYEASNSAQQDAYSLTSFRAGARNKFLFAEAWVKNAFDTRYIPLAFPYPGFAQSGFIGESGRPRTFGISAGLTF